MKYRQLDNIPGNKKASCLTYGTGSDIIMGDDREAAAEVLDMAWEHGFTIFDSANAYGNAEKNVGYWMQKRGNREDIILFDKGCNPGMNGSVV